MCSQIYFYVHKFQFLLVTCIKCEKFNTEKRGLLLIFIIPNNKVLTKTRNDLKPPETT